jgi:hypothetical protein
LIQLGGYAAVEYCGGPSMIFKMGRVDAQEHEASPEGLLPDAHEAGESMFSKLTRAGFTQ